MLAHQVNGKALGTRAVLGHFVYARGKCRPISQTTTRAHFDFRAVFADFKGENRQFEDLPFYPFIGLPGMQSMIAASALYQLMKESLIGVLDKPEKMTWMSCLASGLFPAFISKALRTIWLDEAVAGGWLGGVSAILGKLSLQINYSLFKFGNAFQKMNDQKAGSWRTLVQDFR
jgi:hypothetical protein